MRVKLNAEALGDALKTGVASSKSTLKILEFALLEATDGMLNVTTYNVAMCARAQMPAEVIEPGVICAESNVLRAAMIGGGTIEIHDGLVRRGKSRLKIPTLSADGWPVSDTIRWEDSGISPEALRDALDATSFACRKDDIRPYCRSVVLSDGLCVGTNGHRISMAEIDYKGPSLLVPIENVPHLRRRLTSGAIVQIGYANDKTPSFLAAGTASDRIEVSLEPSVHAPEFRSVDPRRDPDASATMTRGYLISEVERITPFCPVLHKLGPAAKIVMAQSLRISSPDGDSDSELTGELTGEADFGMNLDYLSDALGVSKEEQVTLEFYKPNQLILRDAGVVQIIATVTL